MAIGRRRVNGSTVVRLSVMPVRFTQRGESFHAPTEGSAQLAADLNRMFDAAHNLAR